MEPTNPRWNSPSDRVAEVNHRSLYSSLGNVSDVGWRDSAYKTEWPSDDQSLQPHFPLGSTNSQKCILLSCFGLIPLQTWHYIHFIHNNMYNNGFGGGFGGGDNCGGGNNWNGNQGFGNQGPGYSSRRDTDPFTPGTQRNPYDQDPTRPGVQNYDMGGIGVGMGAGYSSRRDTDPFTPGTQRNPYDQNPNQPGVQNYGGGFGGGYGGGHHHHHGRGGF